MLADIPGLIEGAHEGAGLGDRFLGHVERCRVLLHLVDVNEEDVAAAYKTIRAELKAYGGGLAKKKEIVALSKCDSVTPEVAEEKAARTQEGRAQDAVPDFGRGAQRPRPRAAPPRPDRLRQGRGGGG